MLQRGEPLWLCGQWLLVRYRKFRTVCTIPYRSVGGKVRTRLSGQDQGGIWTEEGAFIHQDAAISLLPSWEETAV